MKIRELTVEEIDCVDGGVNWTLVAEGFGLLVVSGVAVAAGAISGPVGFGLVAVGTIAGGMATTAMAAGFGDASSTGSGSVTVSEPRELLQSDGGGGGGKNGCSDETWAYSMCD